MAPRGSQPTQLTRLQAVIYLDPWLHEGANRFLKFHLLTSKDLDPWLHEGANGTAISARNIGVRFRSMAPRGSQQALVEHVKAVCNLDPWLHEGANMQQPSQLCSQGHLDPWLHEGAN